QIKQTYSQPSNTNESKKNDFSFDIPDSPTTHDASQPLLFPVHFQRQEKDCLLHGDYEMLVTLSDIITLLNITTQNRRISQNQQFGYSQKPEILTEYIENKLDSGQKLFLFKDDIQKAGARIDEDTDNESESSESDQKQETSKVKRSDNQNTQRSETFKTDSQIMKERHPRTLDIQVH
ncbi:MAG: hypothetical protein EZS28_055549, partial [Streblomastix strix]